MRANNATYVELDGVKVVLGPHPLLPDLGAYDAVEAEVTPNGKYDNPILWGAQGKPRLGE